MQPAGRSNTLLHLRQRDLLYLHLPFLPHHAPTLHEINVTFVHSGWAGIQQAAL